MHLIRHASVRRTASVKKRDETTTCAMWTGPTYLFGQSCHRHVLRGVFDIGGNPTKEGPGTLFWLFVTDLKLDSDSDLKTISSILGEACCCESAMTLSREGAHTNSYTAKRLLTDLRSKQPIHFQ